MDDDEFLSHRLAAGESGDENAQDGEVGEHAGTETAAGVADHERVAELQVEQVGRVDSGIEAGEHDGGEARPDGELAIGDVVHETGHDEGVGQSRCAH